MGKEVKYEEKAHDLNTIPSTKSEKNVKLPEADVSVSAKQKGGKKPESKNQKTIN